VVGSGLDGLAAAFSGGQVWVAFGRLAAIDAASPG